MFIFKALYPLAVVGSSEFVKIGNKLTKGRHYEWGTVSVENESHCDFVKLREMLLSTNMIDLIELTHTKHYQLYRAHRLKEMGFRDEDDLEQTTISDSVSIKSTRSRSILDIYHLRRTELSDEIQRQEFDIKEEFVQKVKDKELELRETEKEVTKFNVFLLVFKVFIFFFPFRSITGTINLGESRLNGMNAWIGRIKSSMRKYASLTSANSLWKNLKHSHSLQSAPKVPKNINKSKEIL